MTRTSDSAEWIRALLEAEDIARRTGHKPSSVHLLLAFFTFPNRAQVLLQERGIGDDDILQHIQTIENEPRATLRHLQEHARQFAGGSSARQADCLHMLVAILRNRHCFAYRVLQRAGVSLTALRNLALSYVTGPVPKRYLDIPKPSLARAPSSNTRTRTQTRSKPRSTPAPLHTPHTSQAPTSPLSAAAELDLPTYPMHDDSSADESLAPQIQKPKDGPIAQTQSATTPAVQTEASLAKMAPTLAKCAIDLTELARQNRLDRVIGREIELERLIDTLGKRRSNNPILVGPAGVGKTALVEGLAVKIAAEDEDVAALHERKIVALDTGSMIAGTSLRGAFAERMAQIKQEVAAARGQIVIFIDEIHTLVGAGNSGDGALDAANELKTALARGEFPCIGATTFDEYQQHIEKDPALGRRFDPIVVEEPSIDDAVLMIEGAIQPYVEHHQIPYALDAVHAAVHWTHRFVPERKLPDKAIAVLDLAGSRAKRRQAEGVVRMDVASIIHEWSGVPLERLLDDPLSRDPETFIRHRFAAQDEVVEKVSKAIKRGFAGLNGKRPMASLLFAGPPGVGKTEMVRILADYLFGSRDALVKLDMSEFVEKHSVSRLIGAQRGYIGYEQGGDLTEAVRRRPFQVILFDEIEKAHADVLNILLQILEDGVLTDTKGQKISFANTLIVLTTNLGTEALLKPQVGFSSEGQHHQAQHQSALQEVQTGMSDALWSRIEEKLIFDPLDEPALQRITRLQLEQTTRLLFDEKELRLQWSDDVIQQLVAHQKPDPRRGARPVRHAITRRIEHPLAERLLAGDFMRGDAIRIYPHKDHGFHFERVEQAS